VNQEIRLEAYTHNRVLRNWTHLSGTS